MATAIQHELDGINIDFEHVTKDTAPAYLEFLRELTLKCHANDLIVSVDNYSPASYNAYYDLEEKGRIVDYVVLMAYDEHYNGSEESGSVSSLPFVKEGVKKCAGKGTGRTYGSCTSVLHEIVERSKRQKATSGSIGHERRRECCPGK